MALVKRIGLSPAETDILEFIRAQVKNGRDSFSYLDMAVETNHALSTVQSAVSQLQAQHYIIVMVGRPNRYALIPREQQISRLVSNLAGLVL